MSRPKKRNVTIRFASRNPVNPEIILQAVESVFRPSDLEILVGEDADSDVEPHKNRMALEPQETRAREHARNVLDEKDARIAQKDAKNKRNSEDMRNPDPPDEIIKKRKGFRESIAKMCDKGFTVVVRESVALVLKHFL